MFLAKNAKIVKNKNFFKKLRKWSLINTCFKMALANSKNIFFKPLFKNETKNKKIKIKWVKGEKKKKPTTTPQNKQTKQNKTKG